MSKNIEKFTFFYRTESPFSQWYPSVFVREEHTFCSAEQYMMYSKAILFGDEEIAAKILTSREPRQQKQLGRQVRQFDREVWEQQARPIVYEGNYAKFTQNKDLLQTLLATSGTTLVEASPTDRIWGVGLEEDDPRILSRSTWRGTNWLGEVLTELRENLLTASK